MSTNTYAYNYDDIGNRLSSTSLVSSLSSVCNYSANALNQYTNISCSSSSTTQTPVYDSDGNMLSFNNWTFTWNAENRLIVASNATTIVHYVYDYAGRRFMKTVSENGSMTKDLRFVYDGYVQIAQEDQLQAGSKKQRVWDPSGALLMVRQNNTSYFTCLDGNKNITDIIDATGTLTAYYEYSPFGQITSATGSLKDDFEYRFSSEYFDSETGFVYYNFRYYSPELARWLSKDPIEEKGGLNLYVFVGNDGVGKWDYLGLKQDIDSCFDLVDDLIEIAKKYNKWTEGPDWLQRLKTAKYIANRYIPDGMRAQRVAVNGSFSGGRNRNLTGFSGFRPVLTQGGQNKSVYRHIGFNAAAVLQGTTFLSKTAEASEYAQLYGNWRDYNSGKITREEFEEEVDERVAEINDDISGRAVGNGLEEFLDEEIKENELRTKLLKELCDCEKK